MMRKNYLVIIIPFWCLTEGAAVETKNRKLIWRQVGDSVTVPCIYQPTSNPNGYLDIEWTIRSKISNESDKLIMTLSGGKVYKYYMCEKISFASGNGSHGNASLFIESLDEADSGIYYCKVKKQGTVQQQTWNLTVQGKEQRMDDWNSTVAPRTSSVSQDLSNGSDTSSHKTAVGIALAVTGLVLLIAILLTCLILKVKAMFPHRAAVNASEQPVESQNNVTYSATPTIDQDCVYSTVQRSNIVPTCDQPAVYSELFQHCPAE